MVNMDLLAFVKHIANFVTSTNETLTPLGSV
nr:MAG TPA: hypothetical protein [Caudoviricetes sp.]